jgi:predicted PolB exonuclease-like 3'-5' exonuclease
MEDLSTEVLIGAFSGDTEEARLRKFFKAWTKDRPRLVTFGGRGADVPLLYARAMRYGFRIGDFYDRVLHSKRYETYAHLDLHDALGSFGAQRQGGLSDWARCIGWPGKGDVDGSMVAEMLRQPDGRAKVDAYCLSDAVQTAAVFLRYELTNGELDHDEYAVIAGELLNVAAADERTKALADAVDVGLFMVSP